MTGDLIDDDADIGAAVQSILARGASALGDAPRDDARENRDDREAHERADDADMDDRPDDLVETKAEEGDGKAPSDDGDEQFLEIPGENDGDDPIRVSTTEAAEAVKQIRQMHGDIATAVTKAETEAQEKADVLVRAQAERYQQLEVSAKAALHLMQQFLPQPPDRQLLDQASQYYNPVAYYEQKAYYDEYVEHANKVRATIAQAQQGQTNVLSEADKLEAERENARLARYIPEWGKPETREAKRAEILTSLQAKYGITKEEFEGVTSHKAWRMMNDLAKLSSVQTKAPEIKKAVQEKAAKITNGKMPARDQGSGRFVSEARESLRKTGSVDDAARLFMRNGLTRGL